MESPFSDKLHKVKSFFLINYTPCSYKEMDLDEPILLTTEEIYSKLFALFPHPDFTGDIVFDWLSKGDFKLSDIHGQFEFKWMMKAKAGSSAMNQGYEFPKIK